MPAIKFSDTDIAKVIIALKDEERKHDLTKKIKIKKSIYDGWMSARQIAEKLDWYRKDGKILNSSKVNKILEILETKFIVYSKSSFNRQKLNKNIKVWKLLTK